MTDSNPALNCLWGWAVEDRRARQTRDRLGSTVPVADDAAGIDEHDAVADRCEHARRLRTFFGFAVELRVVDRDTRSAPEIDGDIEVGFRVAPAGLGPE